jgi:hypothetical protein
MMAAGAALLILPISLAQADDGDFAKLLAKYRKDDPKNGLARFQADYQKALAKISTQSRRISDAQAKVSASLPGKSNLRQGQAEGPGDSTVSFLIRQDFSDIWLFDKPTAVSNAKGATLSWANDNIAHDATWSIHGMGAVVVSIPGGYLDKGYPVLGASLAGYAQIDREIHSNLVKKNSDALAGGIAGEIGFDTGPGSQYFRLSAGAVNDRLADQTAFTTMLEWLPIYGGDKCIGSPCSVPGLPVIYRFQPELKLQYDRTTDDGSLIAFSNRKDSFRVGPEFTFLFKPFGPDMEFFSRFHGQVTYHPWYEVFSGKSQYWLDSSVTYNIDDKGHLGLTGSYSRGYTELTGVLTDLFKISLTGKL